MLRKWLSIFWLITFIGAVAFADADPMQTRFSSGEQRVALLELYTSEGCNSCPPADRWLSALKSDPGLWNEFVPLALHVDYWDYIGWQDRFARRDFSLRQKRYVAEGGARFAYTPGFFSAGMEWQGWHAGKPVQSDKSNVGDLNVLANGQDVVVQFVPGNLRDKKLSVHVAVLGMNLSSRVRAGENEGKTLHHDFVALGVSSAQLESFADGYTATLRLPEISENAPERALIAWVSESGTQSPIQSVGGYLPAQ